MVEAQLGLFTIGVFQDVAWATKGLEALKQAGFPPEALSIMSKETPEAAALMERTVAGKRDRFELSTVGAVIVRGPLLEPIQGSAADLKKTGLAGALRRVGFQAHDGRIFETLIGRGGILVAVRGEPRAADALAILHSYGGGNAAIGAWAGRL
jgi:hypothetical protein